MRYKLPLILLSLLMAGCQRASLPGGEGRETERVPVALRANASVMVRSGIESVADLQGLEFGLLAVDPSMEESGRKSALIYGPAQVESASVRFLTRAGADTSYYYPSVVNDCYTFFAYRHTDVRTEDNPSAFDGVWSGGRFLVPDIAIGPRDILWAKAEAPELTHSSHPGIAMKGYNAAYALQAKVWYPGDDSYLPYLQFQHLTSAIRFSLVAASPEAETQMASHVTLTGAVLKDVVPHATLDVLEGSLEPAQEAEDLPLITQPVAPRYNGGEGQLLGDDYLFLLPGQPLILDFRMEVDGSGYVPARPVEVDLSRTPLLAGHTYLFKIKVASARDITLTLIDETDVREGFIFHLDQMTEDGNSSTIEGRI